MKSPNFFSETGLNRMAERRIDSVWLEEVAGHRDAVVLPVWRTHNLIDDLTGKPKAVGLSMGSISDILDDTSHLVFLGYRGKVPYFTIDLSHMDEPSELPPLKGSGQFTDIRNIGLDLPKEDGGLLAYSRAIAQWHKTHIFCSRCGSPTVPRDGGHMRQCTNPDCNTQHVEPGETLEGAVAREVMEEVGIPVTNINYHSSQPWPFPSNLMLGFFAEAESEEINIQDDELAEARWFSREELIDEAREYAQKPHSVSIARRLISEWALGTEF